MKKWYPAATVLCKPVQASEPKPNMRSWHVWGSLVGKFQPSHGFMLVISVATGVRSNSREPSQNPKCCQRTTNTHDDLKLEALIVTVFIIHEFYFILMY